MRRVKRSPLKMSDVLSTVATLMLLLNSQACAEVSFSSQIRPILSDKCFQCHGPDANTRQSDLRFDLRESAIADLGGYMAISPGKPDESEIIRRILATDADERMPPRDSHKQVKPDELALLRQWIAEGALYEGHWSFARLKKPPVPDSADWARNEIDAFIFARLKSEGLQPNHTAAPHALLRRLSLDLTGLPPTPEQIDRFLGDNKMIDVAAVASELLDSSNYGEHMAWVWLDAARYADSDGYESDPLRNMWPWRDWVVDALNRNMPYDQFITEQLAGDLLSGSSLRQKLATGFNRNHRLNNEGGILPEEWIVEYVCDRAETAATVFMGLTWGCARCHDHKFDPITQENYYQLYAFFNNIDEKGSARGTNAPPVIDVPSLTHIDQYEKLYRQWRPLRDQLEVMAKSKQFNSAYTSWLKKVETTAEVRQKLPGKLGKTEFSKWTAAQKNEAKEHFLVHVHAPEKVRHQYAPLNRRLTELQNSGAKVMVMDELVTPKLAFVLERGAYDQPRQQVSADTPAFLPPMDASLPKNRLGLAKWLTSPSHPLTARVAVNRVWEQFFGNGLVKTQEDFGSQGQPPSHPQLLDYLAVRFIESGWDLKSLQLLIVTSATYQQSSAANDQMLSKDPENRLLARGPRYRLSAAVIRDQALAASGLLVDQLGGAPVKPYQPAGLWEEIIKGRVKYTPHTGDKLYRRSLYTLWRRAVKPPLMELLDANLRDTCSVSTKRTNSPLQALLLLNDVTFVEAARQLATRILREGGEADADRLRYAMWLTACRAPSDQELDLLLKELDNQKSHYRSQPLAAQALISIGQSKPDPAFAAIDLAAFTAVARVLLNLDEVLCKS